MPIIIHKNKQYCPYITVFLRILLLMSNRGVSECKCHLQTSQYIDPVKLTDPHGKRLRTLGGSGNQNWERPAQQKRW